MRIKTETYLDLLEQLRMVAINSDNLEQRSRMRDNMLRMLARTFDASSVYILSHNLDACISTVRNHFIGSRAKNEELTSDLGQDYEEQDIEDFLAWLYGDTHQPRLLRVADLDPTSAEYEEYATEGINHVVFTPLHYNGQLWGYIEMWDRRPDWTFTQAKYDKLIRISNAISDTLLTPEG